MVWSAQSRYFLQLRGQDDLKRRPRPLIGRSRQTPLVRLHDRTADRKSHSQAAGLGSEEGVEQPTCIISGDPDTAISYTDMHATRLVLVRSDHDLALTILDRLHGFDTVHHQIDDHLLQL